MAKPAVDTHVPAAHSPTQKSANAASARPAWWYVGGAIIALIVAGTFWPTVVGGLRDPGADIHRPGMVDFFPDALLWGGTNYELNRLTIARFVAALVCALVFVVVAARLRMRPTRGQALVEMGADFVRQNIGAELLGTRRANRYAKLLGFIFFGVLAMNLTGIVPGINIAASSVISVPLIFAAVAYVSFVAAGIKARGGLRFFAEQLFPPGIPWPVYLLLTPIELASTFIVRPATLAIRLLANMIAGHMLLALTYFGTQVLLVGMAAMKPIAIVTLAAAVVVTLFEVFVAVLQAYVFTILTAVYIKMSVEAH